MTEDGRQKISSSVFRVPQSDPETGCASSSQCQFQITENRTPNTDFSSVPARSTASSEDPVLRRAHALAQNRDLQTDISSDAASSDLSSRTRTRSKSPSSVLCRPSSEPGGARRDRTDDLMLAKHALSQLSYGPVSRPAGAQRLLVGLGGLEPPTSRLSSARSNQLSYKPEL